MGSSNDPRTPEVSGSNRSSDVSGAGATANRVKHT